MRKIQVTHTVNKTSDVLCGPFKKTVKSLSEYLDPRAPNFVITDQGVSTNLGSRIFPELDREGIEYTVILVPSGEEAKTLLWYEKVSSIIFKNGLTKNSTIISLGGGVITNLSGFLASTIYRGLNFVSILTTSLAQVDVAVNFKQGINSPEGKNVIGSFYAPSVVFVDTSFLTKLSNIHYISGFAESIKHGLSQDVRFFNLLKAPKTVSSILRRDLITIDTVVHESLRLKAETMDLDSGSDDTPYDMIRQYGHSIGHSIETLGNFTLEHGFAISIGMCLSAEISYLMRFCSKDTVNAHYSIFESYGLPTRLPPEFSHRGLINAMRFDKNYDGEFRMGLVETIGKLASVTNSYEIPVSPSVIEEAIKLNRGE